MLYLGGCARSWIEHWIDYIHCDGNNLKSSYDVVEFNFDIVIHHDDDEVEKVFKLFDVIVDGINLLDPERQCGWR